MKKDHIGIEEVALMHQEIVKKLTQYENGVVSETMNRMGMNYAVNYGLSTLQIDQIAKKIKKSNNLAFYLWQQKERESKLLAIRIFENYHFDEHQISKLITGLTNTELAEQVVIKTLTQLEERYELASKFIKNENFIKFAGFLLISRLAMTDNTADNAIFEHFLIEIMHHLPKEKAIYLRRGLAQALLRIGLRDEGLKSKANDIIKALDKSDHSLFEYLKQEVCYFFN